MRKISLTVLCLIFSFGAIGQELLTYEYFLELVKDFHPVSKQAETTLRFGEQEMRIARGGFDPLLYGNYDQKEFSETEYYRKKEAGLLVPTVGGVELKGVFEQNTGTYLNAERTVPGNGLLAAGASVNLGQGLFIDKRRAALRQAEVYIDATQAERQQILNDLYLEATQVYWYWAASFQNQNLLEESVVLAEIRFEAVKESFFEGSLAAIDTIEAYTQVLNRAFRLQSAEIAYFNATQELNTFLWDPENVPLDIAENSVPQNVLEFIELDFDKEEMRALINNHPLLRLADFELNTLEIERRWKAEQLKPVMKVNYNFLSEAVGPLNASPFFENNYKWGFTFQTSLFLRKERGGLGLVKAKLDFKQSDRELKSIQLRTKLESEINKFETLQRQLGVFNANILGLTRLLEGEQTRFQMGESSLFLINAREVTLLDSRLILNDLEANRKIAYSKMLNAAGLGFDF
ncbi:hypothetical protein P872_20160 [Rhodonellum psychrophilum GCM71 = DSM 17998]|uniref:Transporter n=2 Tax=Rhodonellum TaxID=336827 RepID=U5BUP3_9BACT|nr:MULTISPECIES: TolC family protein [Rhodonellum]ERM81603.1 hypothetical protein P872_20160 [Rhodonellum psychrophilum GCM71 = DSM 17998]SDZ36887.1 Outer membrane protein TolC [Rhodonellum ikkaensis]